MPFGGFLLHKTKQKAFRPTLGVLVRKRPSFLSKRGGDVGFGLGRTQSEAAVFCRGRKGGTNEAKGKRVFCF